MAKRGRPDKLTHEVQEALVKALRLGNFRGPAARFAGISSRTLYEWLKIGEKQHQGKFRVLLSAVRKAEADAEVAMVARLMEHAKKDTRAVQFYLERKHAARWGKRDRVTLQGDAEAAPVQIEVKDANLAKLSDEQLAKLVEILDSVADPDEG